MNPSPTRIYAVCVALCLVVMLAAYGLGATQGWINEIAQFRFPILGTYWTVQCKPITLFLYSCLGAFLSALLLIRPWLLSLPRWLILGVFFGALLLEGVWIYEATWHFLNWAQHGLPDTPYFIFYTKLNVVEVMGCISVQAATGKVIVE